MEEDNTDHNTEHGNLKRPWKPGESGNPKGRPKGSKNVKTRLKELLAVIPPEETLKALREHGYNDGELDYQDALLIAQIKKAEKGSTQAARFVAEYIQGKPTQPISGDEEHPIKIEMQWPKPKR